VLKKISRKGKGLWKKGFAEEPSLEYSMNTLQNLLNDFMISHLYHITRHEILFPKVTV